MENQPTTTDLVVVTAAGELVATRSGDGDPVVVLLHAGVTDRREFGAVAALLAPLATLAYDRRGFGTTPAADVDPLSDLRSVLDLVDHPIWLVGSSQGGGLALRAALELADRVSGLVLLSPAVPGLALGPVDPTTTRLDEEADAARSRADVEAVLDHEAQLWLDGPTQAVGRVTGAPRALFRTMDRRVVEQEIAGAELSPGEHEVWPRVSELALPVVVAVGEHDVPAFVERSHRLAEAIPGARLEPLPGSAHLPCLDAPEAVAALIATQVGR